MIILNIFQLFITLAKNSAFLASVVSKTLAIENAQRKCNINQYNVMIKTITNQKSIFT